jgi:hypothetical protein
MTFTPNIPGSNQSLGVSRPLIVGNFTAISTALAVNHIALNSSGAGKHKFVQMPVQGSAPAVAANEGVLYTKTQLAISNLFWKRDASATEIQLTNINPTNAVNGCSFLPGGLLIQWGQTITTGGSGGGTTAVIFTTTFTLAGVNTNAYSVIVTADTAAIAAGQNLTVDAVTHSGFSLKQIGYAPAGRTVNYIAIGPKT